MRIHNRSKLPQEVEETQNKKEVESVVIKDGEGGRLAVSYLILLPRNPAEKETMLTQCVCVCVL